DQLQAVTNTKEWKAAVVDALVGFGGAFFIDARWATREDDAARAKFRDRIPGNGERMNLAINVRLANASRNQLCVLRSEVEDNDHGTLSSSLFSHSDSLCFLEKLSFVFDFGGEYDFRELKLTDVGRSDRSHAGAKRADEILCAVVG